MSEDVVMGEPGPSGMSHGGQPATPAVLGEDSLNTTAAGQEEDESAELEGIDIKASLKHVFSLCQSGFKGTYATSAKYPSAPNPCLEIDNFGTLGLPLSSAEAGRLRARCNPAPFGRGERTVVDPSVRDTFELDGSAVRFTNSLFDGWLDEAVAQACAQLGVTGKQFRFELYKLLLYETGSHFNMHQDTEKSPGMFATVVVVLPSSHEGGVVRVKHGQQEKLFDSGSESNTTTSVLSWYTDVHHEVKPVTKGFRLALSFNLIYSGNQQAVPRAPTGDYTFQRISDALKAWQAKDRAGKHCPRRLLHVLSHDYSQANLSFAHLKGADSTLVNLLREAADARGFCVALGHLDYTVTGAAEGDPYGDGYHEVTLGDVESRSLDLQLISGTTGVNIGRKEYIEDSEPGGDDEDADVSVGLLVDDDYWDKEGADDQEYEGYQGNYAGNLELFYHRTVVVFWPRSKNAAIITHVGGLDVCVAELKSCTSLRPTATDLDNVALALSAGKPDIAAVVADLALRWKDAGMWHAALKSCRGESDVHSLGMQRVQSAVASLGFSAMRPALDGVVSNTMSTKERLWFIGALPAYTADGEDAPLVQHEWMAEKRRYVLSSLRTPKLEDVDSIISVLVALSDAKVFLCDTLLPQLQALNLPHDWWMAFTAQLKVSPNTDTSLPDWESPVFEVAKLVFDKAIQQAPSNQSRFSLLNELESAWASHEAAVSWIQQTRRWAMEHLTSLTADDLGLVMELVRTEGGFFLTTLIPTLRETDYADSFWPNFIARLELYSLEGGNTLPEDWSSVVAEALHTPLTKAQLQAPSNAHFFAILDRIALAAPEHEHFGRIAREHTRAALRKLKPLTMDEIPMVVNKLKDDVECGSTLLVPQLEAFKFNLKLDFWESMAKTLHGQLDEFCRAGWAREQLRALLGTLASKAVASAKFPPHVAQAKPPVGVQPSLYAGYPYYARAPAAPAPPKPPVDTVTPIINDTKRLLVLCLLAEHAQLATGIFRKIFTTYTTADAIKSIVVPLVPAVLSVLRDYRTTADAPPFDQFFRETVRSFITTVLGTRPSSQDVSNWARTLQSRCSCADCTDINARIVAENQVVWAATQVKRRHVERSLAHIPDIKISTRQSARNRLQEMVIDKVNGPVDVWKKKSAEALQLLRSIGSDAQLASIYAPVPGQLKLVLAYLQGTGSPSALAVAPFMTDSPSSSSRVGNAFATSSSASAMSGPVASSSTAASGAPVASSSAAAGPSTSTIPRKRKAPPADPKEVIEISD